MTIVNDPRKVLDEFIESCDSRVKAFEASVRGRSWLEAFQPCTEAYSEFDQTTSALAEGRKRYDLCVDILTKQFKDAKFGTVKFSNNQRKFFKKGLTQLLPVFYKECWDEEADQILASHQVSSYVPHLYAKWPRRDGKSQALAALTIAVALSNPGIKIVAFSIGKRISGDLKDICKSYLTRIDNYKDLIGPKDNQEGLWLVPYGCSKENAATYARISFLPGGCGAKLRGTSANWVQLEEAEFVDPNLIQDVIQPLLSLKRMSLTAISSPGASGAENHMEQLARCTRDDGTPLWDKFAVENMCKACQKNPSVMECFDMMVEIPHWKSARQIQDQRSQYKNDPRKYRREILGLTESEDIPDFEKQDLDALKTKDRVTFTYENRPKWLFHHIDPGEGSEGSDTGITTLALNRDHQLVVSVHVFCLSDESI